MLYISISIFAFIYVVSFPLKTTFLTKLLISSISKLHLILLENIIKANVLKYYPLVYNIIK
jgi:hypothetical protein